ncbi:MAG: nitroreductase family protein [Eggerthellaceae bacterium]|nr:nitroreductase family protein [Eggerthellaceae bacterium]MBQ9069390.1 nitroreductase family protein [Eggerthellaceae bacterium]
MGAERTARFAADATKCIRCGRCVAVCTGMVLEQQGDDPPRMLPFERYGWRGCWRCEHCLAVCPTGAITIFGKRPEGSLPPAPPETGEYLERLVANRRSCRRYLDENVDPAIVSSILAAMQNAPAGGNSQTTEYTVVDDRDRIRAIRDVAYAAMEEAAAHGRYTSSFDDFYYAKMKQSEETVRKGDMLFCGAPHLFVAHAKATGRWAADIAVNCNLATAYFELLANAHGLGTVIMSYPSDVVRELAPEAREMLGIPADHYMKLLVGFGYPEVPYARGVQKDRRKVHRWSEQAKGQLSLL